MQSGGHDFLRNLSGRGDDDACDSLLVGSENVAHPDGLTMRELDDAAGVRRPLELEQRRSSLGLPPAPIRGTEKGRNYEDSGSTCTAVCALWIPATTAVPSTHPTATAAMMAAIRGAHCPGQKPRPQAGQQPGSAPALRDEPEGGRGGPTRAFPRGCGASGRLVRPELLDERLYRGKCRRHSGGRRYRGQQASHELDSQRVASEHNASWPRLRPGFAGGS